LSCSIQQVAGAKKCHVARISYSEADVVAVGSSHSSDVVETTERQRLDLTGGWVLFGVRAEPAVERKIGLSRDWVDARVGGPHAGEALRDGAKVVLHCSRLDLVVAVVAGQRAGTDLVGKDLKD